MSVSDTVFDNLVYATADAVATISLNRPEIGNGMSLALLAELKAAVALAEEDAAIRVVILRGNGKNFCVGADLTDKAAQAKPVDEHLLNDHKPILMLIRNSSKTYIAVIQGAAAGIGSAYAMLCDMTVMAEDAYIYQAFVPIGLVPDGGASWLLGRQIGYKRAFKMIVEGTKLDAQTCLDWGLASDVVRTAELEQRSMELANTVASKAPLAVAATKRLLHDVFSEGYEETISSEAAQQMNMMRSGDALEGVNAFLEKRKPAFKGE